MIDSNGRLLPEVGDLFVVPVGWPEGQIRGRGPARYPQLSQIKSKAIEVEYYVGGGPYY